MPLPKRTHSTHEKLPPHQPPGHHAVQGSLATLRNWREGSVATAIVMAALLPFAVAWHTTYLIAIATCLIAAAILAASCHIDARTPGRDASRHPRAHATTRIRREAQATSQHPQPPSSCGRAAANGCPDTTAASVRYLPHTPRPRCSRPPRTAPARRRARANQRSRPGDRSAHTRAPHERLQPALQPQPPRRRPPPNHQPRARPARPTHTLLTQTTIKT